MNDFKNIIDTDLTSFSKEAYLNYSMYVILDRALPKVEDGLKPVQRRILFAMDDLNLSSKSKHKKSARTVGDVLGKYHPHGDSACYEAMVIMAQPFNYRHPLIDGQGNWGAQDDPKSYAAMRYTESRLTGYASTLLSEIKSGTTDFQPNFDGTLKEPIVLPSQVPNILLNNVTGIAVGMSCEIPSHNLEEVVKATSFLLDHPGAKEVDLLDFLPAPDLASGGIITTSRSDFEKIYSTGLGSFKVRSKYHIENKNNIVITELPFRVQGTKVIEKIASLMSAKKISMIDDIRDEADHENPIRIVISLKKNIKASTEQIMEHLFSVTDLEVSNRVEMRMIGLNGKPQTKSLKTILNEWILFRQNTIIKKLKYRLNKIEERLHLIHALFIVYLNVEEVIEIIRHEEDPKNVLQERFELTEIQANYILDTKLRSLARLEENALITEKESLESEALIINDTLNSKTKLNSIIKKIMKNVVKEYGSKRITTLQEVKEIQSLSEDDLVSSEPITVVLSKKGWVRAGKGHSFNPESLQYKTGDLFLAECKTESNKESILFDDTGKSFVISNSVLPSAKSLGIPVTSLIKTTDNASIIDIFTANKNDLRVVVSKEGYGFMCSSEDFYSKQKKGKSIINCNQHSALKTAIVNDADKILVATHEGYLIVFNKNELPILKKGKGNKLINLSNEDYVVKICGLNENSSITIKGKDKTERWTQSKIDVHNSYRGRKGKKVPRTFGFIQDIIVE